MKIFCWLHLLISFWEPSTNLNSSVFEPGGYRDSSTYPTLLAIEFIILAVYWIDFSLDTYNRGSGVLTAGKWQVNLGVTLLLFIDLIIEASLKRPFVRFGRPLRVVKIVYQSRR
jgi:hypothetical protein